MRDLASSLLQIITGGAARNYTLNPKPRTLYLQGRQDTKPGPWPLEPQTLPEIRVSSIFFGDTMVPNIGSRAP